MLSLLFLVLAAVLPFCSAQFTSPLYPTRSTLVSGGSPSGIVYDGLGHVWVSAGSGPNITAYNLDGSVFKAAFTFPLLPYAGGLAVDASHNVYVTDVVNERIIKFSQSGVVLQNFTVTNGATLGFSHVAIDPVTQNVWGSGAAIDDSLPVIIGFAPNGTAISSFLGSYFNPYPALGASVQGIAFDAAGNLYASDSFHCNISRLARGSSAFTAFYTFSPSNTATSGCVQGGPGALTTDVFGNVIAASGPVVVLSPQGQLLASLSVTASPTTSGVTTDAQGNIYATNPGVTKYTRLASSTSSSGGAAPSTGGLATASLCVILYGLPGNVDYPWSVAYNLQITYNSTVMTTSEIYGTHSNQPYVFVSATTGTRTFTNKFGAVTTTAVTSQYLNYFLYTNNSQPLTTANLYFAQPIQLPGYGPLSPVTSVSLGAGSGVNIYEALGGAPDPQGYAVLSSVANFLNTTIGASNQNSLAVNYAQCQAPISFTNGLRPSFQPTAASASTRFRYTYTLSDNVYYTVTANLTMTTSSQFATTVDQLGNAYQTITSITGTRNLTFLAASGRTDSIVSTVTGLSNVTSSNGLTPSNRWYPYSLLVSSPNVYSVNTAPFVDGNGFEYTFSPAQPAAGSLSSASSVTVHNQPVFNTGAVGLTEGGQLTTVTSIRTQLQTYTLL